MKTLRNALTALLTALLIMGTLPFTALAADNTAGAPLQFKNGKFKILILSDIQDTNTPQQATVDLMNNAIDQTKPDFIALTGQHCRLVEGGHPGGDQGGGGYCGQSH